MDEMRLRVRRCWIVVGVWRRVEAGGGLKECQTASSGGLARGRMTCSFACEL